MTTDPGGVNGVMKPVPSAGSGERAQATGCRVVGAGATVALQMTGQTGTGKAMGLRTGRTIFGKAREAPPDQSVEFTNLSAKTMARLLSMIVALMLVSWLTVLARGRDGGVFFKTLTGR